jgi:hypothetical protein
MVKLKKYKFAQGDRIPLNLIYYSYVYCYIFNHNISDASQIDSDHMIPNNVSAYIIEQKTSFEAIHI